MSDVFSHALSLRAGGYVRRWHTVHTLREQRVDSHSGQAVSLLLCLHPAPSHSLIKAVLWHDCSERVVGDAPSPGLRAFPEYRRLYEELELVVALRDHPPMHTALTELTTEERQWLRAVDLLEAFLFAREEIRIGNSRFNAISGDLYAVLNVEGTPTPVMEFLDWYMRHGHDMRFV